MVNRSKISIWDVLIWAGILLLLGWALLKAFGVLHSPIWVEMIPYFSIGVTAIGGAYKLGKIMNGIEDTEEKVDKLVNMESRFALIEHEHNLCKEGKLNFHHKKI